MHLFFSAKVQLWNTLTSSQAGRCARQETDNQVKIKLRNFCSVAPNEWLVLSINCMCSAHHDPSESLVPVSDISREKRGPCSVRLRALLPFNPSTSSPSPLPQTGRGLRGSRGGNVKGWFISTLYVAWNKCRSTQGRDWYTAWSGVVTSQIFPTTASFGGVNIIVNSNYKLFKYFSERSIIVFICGFFD